jgi:hypothetical protein
MTHVDDAAIADLLARLGEDGAKDLFRRPVAAGVAAADRCRVDRRDRRRPQTQRRTVELAPQPAARGCCQRRLVMWSCGPQAAGRIVLPVAVREPRRRVDKALWAVIMTAYITGTSTRKGRRPRPGTGLRIRSLEEHGAADLR